MNKSTTNTDLAIEGLSSNMHITKEINNYDSTWFELCFVKSLQAVVRTKPYNDTTFALGSALNNQQGRASLTIGAKRAYCLKTPLLKSILHLFHWKRKVTTWNSGEPNKTPMSPKPILWGAKTKRGEGAVILAFKSLIKTVWSEHKGRYTDQCNEWNSPETNPCTHTLLSLGKTAKNYQVEKPSFL